MGSSVQDYKVGDRVVINPNESCARCIDCSRGNGHFCPKGFLHSTIGLVRDGGLAEYAVVPSIAVNLVPPHVPPEHAVLVEPLACIVSTPPLPMLLLP